MSVTGTAAGFRRPETAQAAVLTEIRRLILDGELPPGAPIRQESIASTLGVSRVPVREALKILDGEGQVTYRPHRGYTVTELSLDDVREIYRLRELLEAEAVRVAVGQLTDADVARMREALIEMEQVPRDHVADMAEANGRFHETLLDGCRMPHLLRHVRLLRQATSAYRSLYYMDDHALDVVHSEHRAIMEAVEARDAERAVEMTGAHRAHALRAFERLLGGEG